MECSGNQIAGVEPVAPSGASIIITAPDRNIIEASDLSNVVSVVVDVSLEDITEDIGGGVEICIQSLASSQSDLCLGFLDETLSPPEWVCEDPCLQENSDGLLCGSTTHFTNFALLLSNGDAADGCTSTKDFDYITGHFWGDFGLVIGVSCLVCCCALLIIILGLFTPPGKRIALGKGRAHEIRIYTHSEDGEDAHF